MKKSEIERLALAFDETTEGLIQDSGRKADLARALNDREALVKQQIVTEVLRSTRRIFERTYREITGEYPWRES